MKFKQRKRSILGVGWSKAGNMAYIIACFNLRHLLFFWILKFRIYVQNEFVSAVSMPYLSLRILGHPSTSVNREKGEILLSPMTETPHQKVIETKKWQLEYAIKMLDYTAIANTLNRKGQVCWKGHGFVIFLMDDVNHCGFTFVQKLHPTFFRV